MEQPRAFSAAAAPFTFPRECTQLPVSVSSPTLAGSHVSGNSRLPSRKCCLMVVWVCISLVIRVAACVSSCVFFRERSLPVQGCFSREPRSASLALLPPSPGVAVTDLRVCSLGIPLEPPGAGSCWGPSMHAAARAGLWGPLLSGHLPLNLVLLVDAPLMSCWQLPVRGRRCSRRHQAGPGCSRQLGNGVA